MQSDIDMEASAPWGHQGAYARSAQVQSAPQTVPAVPECFALVQPSP